MAGLSRSAPTAPKLQVPGRLVRDPDPAKRAREVLPGGVNSPVRAMDQIGHEIVFIERGSGCEITDREGRTYIDWVGSWGPLILGHADSEVVAAVKSAAKKMQQL